MEKVEGVGGGFLQFHRTIYGHSHTPFRALLLNYYISKQKMHKIPLKLQQYCQTPTATYFGPYLPIIGEHIIL
jgi:hypothetical protein